MIPYKEQQRNRSLMEYVVIPITEQKKSIQRGQVLAMLRMRPCRCIDFMRVGIAQYNARIFELKRPPFSHIIIYNRKKKVFELLE